MSQEATRTVILPMKVFIDKLLLQEGAAAGVKDTVPAQKLRKAMQALEAAMQRVQDSSGHLSQLTDRIAAAEAAGMAPSLIQAAKAVEKQALLAEVTPLFESKGCTTQCAPELQSMGLQALDVGSSRLH